MFFFLGNNNEDEATDIHSTHLASILGARLYRSGSTKTLSTSSVTSLSVPRTRYSSFVSNAPSISQHIEAGTTITSSSSIRRDRSINFSSLEYDSSLSEYDQNKFDAIRLQIPDEFEQLLPILLKLGVILWPKKFFNNHEQLTTKESKQRDRLLTILEKDQENFQRQRQLQCLYGNVLPNSDILHKHQSLRENLSFQGQLSLVAAYRDEIENELTKKIQHWRSIPMKTMRTSLSEMTNSTPHYSSILANTFHAKHKFLQALTTRNTQVH